MNAASWFSSQSFNGRTQISDSDFPRLIKIADLRDAQHKLWRAWRYLRKQQELPGVCGDFAAMEELMQACVRIVDEIHSL
jgi:hypothetical protein